MINDLIHETIGNLQYTKTFDLQYNQKNPQNHFKLEHIHVYIMNISIFFYFEFIFDF